jgi:phospholipase A1
MISNINTPYKIVLFCIVSLTMSDMVEAEETTNVENANETSALDRRIQAERSTRFLPFVLTPHKPNYVLPITYNETPNNTPFDTSIEGELDNYEIKFQISVKFPIVDDPFGEQGSIQFAYTNLSFWQAYNRDSSSPFRETVHEPELFLVLENDWDFGGFKNRLIQLGAVHQSNGQSGTSSRSWNRIYADFIFERGKYYLSFKPWIRVGELDEDDNPDIETYMGHGEFRAMYAGSKHKLSIMLRNNFHSPNYGAIEIDWSFPMSRRAKWFIQYFNGYGESLIDYNASVNRLGVGIALTDWL